MIRPEETLCDECGTQISGDVYLEISAHGDGADEEAWPSLIRDNCILNTDRVTHLCSRKCAMEFLLLEHDVPGTSSGEKFRRLRSNDGRRA